MKLSYRPCVRRQRNTPYWQAVLKLATGRRTNRSTKQTDRAKALKVALRMQQQLEGKC
jgi:hypothetical protein